ncbi:MAG: hypothetical protein HY560_02775 [Gemmatimonadetes bacterium]|nr:hypothetical protein [Gemmatimonadota bacterium]
MIELLVVLLILGVAMMVFYPVLTGAGALPRSRRVAENPGDVRATLLRQKERLLQNLRELEAERAAGRVSPADFEALKQNDEAEAGRILRRLDELAAVAAGGKRGTKRAPPPAAAPAPRRRAGAVLAWVGGVTTFAVLLGLTMSRAIAPREAGGSITGSMPGGEAGASAGGGDGASLLFPSSNAARRAELERLIRRDSANVPALLEVGHLYLAEQRFDEAARVTLKALSLDPQAAEAHAHIAVLLLAEASSHQHADSARTALDGAVRAIDQALRLKPDLAEGWLFKGMIMMAGLRDQQGAAEAWQQYLRYAPPGADTARIAAMVRAAQRGGR